MTVDITKIWNDEKCPICGSKLEGYHEFKWCIELSCPFEFIRHFPRKGKAIFELSYNQDGGKS